MYSDKNHICSCMELLAAQGTPVLLTFSCRQNVTDETLYAQATHTEGSSPCWGASRFVNTLITAFNSHHLQHSRFGLTLCLFGSHMQVPLALQPYAHFMRFLNLSYITPFITELNLRCSQDFTKFLQLLFLFVSVCLYFLV